MFAASSRTSRTRGGTTSAEKRTRNPITASMITSTAHPRDRRRLSNRLTGGSRPMARTAATSTRIKMLRTAQAAESTARTATTVTVTFA
jgi:hypothetical protein